MEHRAMRAIVVGGMILCVVAPALGGINSDARVYVSFNGCPDGNATPFVGPGIYEASLYVDQLADGTSGVSLSWQTSGFGVPLTPVYPSGGATLTGGPDDGEWIVEWECAYPSACGFVKVVTVPYYANSPGIITISAPNSYGLLVADCLGGVDVACVAANGGIGMDPPPPDVDCINVHPPTHITCEPQGGDHPLHPPTYWYDVHVHSYEGIWRFAVQTFDPDEANYSNWVQPDGWEHSLQTLDDQTWVVWETPDQHDEWYDHFLFQFDNPSPSEWGDWTASDSGGYESASFSECQDGYGYRVHVPGSSVSTRESTWGSVKTLYR